MTEDTLRRIAEDAFLLAAKLREGESLEEEAYLADSFDPEESEAMRQWRVVELVVNLGERIVNVAGLAPDTVRVTKGVIDLLDPNYCQVSTLFDSGSSNAITGG